MNNPELKPCPKCHSKDVILTGMSDLPDEVKDFIECTGCKYYWYAYDNFKTVAEAIEAWNKRYDPR